MSGSAKRGLKKSVAYEPGVPSHAEVEFVGLAESDGRSDVRARRQEEVEDAVLVAAREAPARTSNFIAPLPSP